MNLKPLPQEQLPAWDDAILDEFIGQWLKLSNIIIEKLPEQDYNNELQELVRTVWLGENVEDKDSVSEYHEFRFSVCLYLDRFLPREKHRRNFDGKHILIIQDQSWM